MATDVLGARVKRVEDPKFITGRGRYLDDISMPGMTHVAILRSIFAHARIRKIDTSRAEALKGVLAVVTGPEVVAQTKTLPPRAINKPAQQWVMAGQRVLYLGEPLADARERVGGQLCREMRCRRRAVDAECGEHSS